MTRRMGLAFAELFHGVDERIPVDGFKRGMRVLYEVAYRCHPARVCYNVNSLPAGS